MIWLTGGSIGHHFAGIRIVGKTSGKNLFVLNGIVRFIVKVLLGIFSLVSMLITKKHQAIHDLLSNSVVIFKDENSALPQHKLAPRKTVFSSQKPSLWRRLIVVIVYSIIVFFTISVITALFVSAKCTEFNQCSETEDQYLMISGLVFIALFCLILLFGFLCKLPGAYFRGSKNV